MSPLVRFALRTFAGLVATVLVAALIIFSALEFLPGDPARFILGIDATPAALNLLRQQLGLDASPFARFFGWLGGMLAGNFGVSASQGLHAGPLIAGRLAVTLPLTILAMLLSAGIGLSLGFVAARRRGSVPDTTLLAVARVGVATPNFWLGMLLVLLFAVTLRWFPTGGFVPWGENPLGAFASLILPALALALPLAALLARTTRDLLVDVQDSDYLRAARAKGLTLTEALHRHGLRNVLLPLLSIIGMQFGYLVAGSVLVENVFYLPGLGRLIFDAISARDLPLIRAGLITLVILTAAVMFLADLARGWADPRLHVRGDA